MPQQIEIAVEKMNRGNWLRIVIPYKTSTGMTATLLKPGGETLTTMFLETGNNLIDIGAFTQQTINIKIDTPYETLLKELKLE
jgi:hypothetical protein